MPRSEQATAEKVKIKQGDFRRLWKRSPIEWVKLLNTLGAARVSTQGPVLTFCCPYHPDNTPSAKINTARLFFKCYGCNKFLDDPIKLIAHLTGAGYSAALESYKTFFGGNKDLDLEAFSKEDIQQKRLLQLATALHTYLCGVWDMTDTLRTETMKTAIKWLQARKVAAVREMPSLGLLPRIPQLELTLRQGGATEEDVAWCRKYIGEHASAAYIDSIVYIYATAPDRVTAFKLRPGSGDKDATRLITHLDHDEELGAFGVLTPAFYPHYGSENVKRFMAVEGEHDQIALYLAQAAANSIDDVVWALGGSGTRGVSFAKTLGFEYCRLVGDDDAAGQAYPTKVLPKSHGISFEIFQWPQSIRDPQGGNIDPDDAVRLHTGDKVMEALRAPGHWLYAMDWAIRAAGAEVQGINPNNVIALKKVAEKYAAYFTSETETVAFGTKFETLCPLIPAAQVARAALAASDSPRGFTARIVEWYQRHYQVTTWSSSSNEMSLWHIEKGRSITVSIDGIGNIPKLLRDFGHPSVYDWAKAELGLPSYLPDPDAEDATESTLGKCEAQIEKAINRALRALSTEANEDVFTIKGQGIHLVHARKRGYAYIVNGKWLYKIYWDDKREKITNAELLRGPVDGKEMFDLGRKPALINDMEKGWTSLFRTPEDLCATPPFTLEETFRKVHEIINTVFGFTHQETDSLYCAGVIFYNYLHDIFEGRRMLTHFSAEYASGKTSLLSVTANHSPGKGYSLCDHACALDSFTQAGFYQLFSNTRLVAALDEMNDPNDRSMEAMKKQEFYAKCRSLATSGYASVSQGTQDGTGKQYNLHTSIITAAGTLINNEMDDSRFNTIFLAKGKKTSVHAALHKYLHSDYADLRKSIFLHALNMAPRVSKEYVDMYLKYGQKTNTVYSEDIVLDRFTENLMPVAAILNVIGLDGAEFILKYRKSRQGQRIEKDNNTLGHQLIHTVINAPIPSKEEDTHFTTIKTMLLNPNQRDKINQSRTGVYYDAITKWLVLAWAEMKPIIKDPALKRPIASLMFELKSARGWYVDPQRAVKHGVFDRMYAEGLLSNPSTVSVINVSEKILMAVEAAQQRLRDAPPPEPTPPVPPAPQAPAAAPTQVSEPGAVPSMEASVPAEPPTPPAPPPPPPEEFDDFLSGV